MSRKSAVLVLGVFVCLFLAADAVAGAATTKIKVVVENAAVRLNPSLDSEAIEENVAVDTVFTSEKKVGEWYEVKFKTQLGVDVVGYIHEMYVEVLAGEAAQPAAQPVTYRDEPARMAAPSGGLSIKPGIRLGGMLASLTPGYDWTHVWELWGEDATISESVANNGSTFSFDAEFGLFVIPYVEITAGFSMASKALEGTYYFDIPGYYYYNDYASAETTQTVNFKANYISFGLNFYPMPHGRISPFIGLGGCSVSATMDLWEDFSITDYYNWNYTHNRVEINEIMTSNEKLSKFGFYVRGGLKVLFSPMFYVYLQGKYVIAKADLEHLMEEYFPGAEALSINLGGFFAGIGLGISF